MGRRRRREPTGDEPIPAEPVDLLAGLAPGVELLADDPAAARTGRPPRRRRPAVTTVADAGKLVRSGDATVRRLIRTPLLAADRAASDASDDEPDRAGVVPKTRERPGE